MIAVLGTHGAGKSTLVATVTQGCRVTPVADPRGLTKMPVAMRCQREGPPFLVLGWYADGAMSGIDSGRFAGRLGEVYEWMREVHAQGDVVLYEGMLVASTWRRLVALGPPATALVLTTSVDDCVAALRTRKAARRGRHKNSQRPVDQAVVLSKHRAIQRVADHLTAAGVRVQAGDRGQLLTACLEMCR